ncbi:addiction module protein [bacterium]|nr:addiction module protein [bacterium]MBU1958683.1 addiction module protein [bacterium]
MSFNDIKSMPISQRVHLMETLWESLRTETTEPESPEWHKEILEARMKKLKEGKVKTYTLDELKARR